MLGKELQCIHKIGDVHDLYAFVVVKTGTDIFGHLPIYIRRFVYLVNYF